jgi:formylglycine-generating enzyme
MTCPRPRRIPLTNSIVAAGMLAAGLAGCVAVLKSGYDLPKPVATEQSQVPVDAASAAAVILDRMRGDGSGAVAGAGFAPKVGLDLREKRFVYRDFAVKDHVLLRHGSGDDGSTIAAGRLDLKDPLGRQTEVLYYADYRSTNDGIEITRAQTATLYSLSPKTLVFVVPAERLQSVSDSVRRTHDGLLEFAATNAVTGGALRDVPAGARDYVVFAFILDRVSPSAEVTVMISESRNGTGGYSNASQYVDFDGWRVGVLPGNFDLRSSNHFVKVAFRPGEEISFVSRKSQIVRLVSLNAADTIRQLEESQQSASIVVPPSATPRFRPAAPAPAAPSVQPAVGVFPQDQKPDDTFKDCDTCPEMVVVPAGRFTMGARAGEAAREGIPDDQVNRDQPLRQVTIARSFALAKHEVTRGEFDAFVGESGYSAGGGCNVYTGRGLEAQATKNWLDPGYRQTEQDPAVCVGWEDAQAYVKWLSLKTGRSYRLPSEAEWEYAARAGTATARYWGDGADDVCGYANTADLTGQEHYPEWTAGNCGDGYVHTAPVGRFEANRLGLHDMLGNVREWVDDCWHDSYAGAPTNESAWKGRGNCSSHLSRGGSWLGMARDARAADRGQPHAVGLRRNDIGFRVAQGNAASGQ